MRMKGETGLIPKAESKTLGDGEFEPLGEKRRAFLPRCLELLGNGIGVRTSAKVLINCL